MLAYSTKGLFLSTVSLSTHGLLKFISGVNMSASDSNDWYILFVKANKFLIKSSFNYEKKL